MSKKGLSLMSGYTLPGEGNSVVGNPPARESSIDEEPEEQTRETVDQFSFTEICRLFGLPVKEREDKDVS